MGKESKNRQVIVYRCESDSSLYPRHKHPYTKRKSWGNLPSPSKDTLDYIRDHEVCGCINLKQFHKWWPKGKWVTKEPRNQYLIMSISKEHIRKGEHQIVFKRSKAKIIGALTKDHKRVFFNESFTYRDYKRQKRAGTSDW